MRTKLVLAIALVGSFVEDQRLGAAGCKIRYPDGTLQHAGVELEWPRAIVQHVGWHAPDDGQYDTPRDYEYVTGAAIARRPLSLSSSSTACSRARTSSSISSTASRRVSVFGV